MFFVGEPRVGQASPPGPLSTMWRGGVAPGPGLRVALDCGLRRNDRRLGAVNRAPTQKTYPCEEGRGRRGRAAVGRLIEDGVVGRVGLRPMWASLGRAQ